MNTKIRRLLATIAASVGVGVLATAIIASGENGYTAGFIVLPILIFEGLVCLVLYIVGVANIAKDNLVGFYFLVAVPLLPIATVGSGMLAKKFEIGAYRVEPMTPIIPPIANKIVFKKGITDTEVQEFWREVLWEPHASGRGEMSLPGIQSIGTNPSEDGSEIIVFSFHSNATEEQRSFVRNKITSSPKVQQLLENVDTTVKEAPTHQANATNNNGSPKKSSKVVITK